MLETPEVECETSRGWDVDSQCQLLHFRNLHTHIHSRIFVTFTMKPGYETWWIEKGQEWTHLDERRVVCDQSDLDTDMPSPQA